MSRRYPPGEANHCDDPPKEEYKPPGGVSCPQPQVQADTGNEERNSYEDPRVHPPDIPLERPLFCLWIRCFGSIRLCLSLCLLKLRLGHRVCRTPAFLCTILPQQRIC